jgi:hypothetical protein
MLWQVHAGRDQGHQLQQLLMISIAGWQPAASAAKRTRVHGLHIVYNLPVWYRRRGIALHLARKSGSRRRRLSPGPRNTRQRFRVPYRMQNVLEFVSNFVIIQTYRY